MSLNLQLDIGVWEKISKRRLNPFTDMYVSDIFVLYQVIVETFKSIIPN